MGTKPIRVGVALLLLLVLGLMAVYVWPTRYRYDHLRLGPRDHPVRIDRFSGEAEYLDEDGWRPLRRMDL